LDGEQPEELACIHVNGIPGLAIVGSTILASAVSHSWVLGHRTTEQTPAGTKSGGPSVRAVRAVTGFVSDWLSPSTILNSLAARNGALEAYVTTWTIVLLCAVGVVWATERATGPVRNYGPFDGVESLSRIAAYRVAEILFSRLRIMVTYAGTDPFSLDDARRALLLAGLSTIQIVTAFGIMYDGWSNQDWSHPHGILGFSYISLRIVFTLGPPDEALTSFAKLLIGCEVVVGLIVIVLGVTAYMAALRDARRA
jgi:hypothetical protein